MRPFGRQRPRRDVGCSGPAFDRSHAVRRQGATLRLPSSWQCVFSVARWQITVFDDATDELDEAFFVEGPSMRLVRELWKLRPHQSVVAEFLITEEQIGALNQVLPSTLQLRPQKSMFLGLVSEFTGETVTEDDA